MNVEDALQDSWTKGFESGKLQMWVAKYGENTHAWLPPSAQEVRDDTLENLLDAYWGIAFSEGKTGVSRGDEANHILHKLRSIFKSVSQAGVKDMNVEEKSAKEIWNSGFESGKLHERAIWAAKLVDAPPACLNNLMRKEQLTCKTCAHVDCPHYDPNRGAGENLVSALHEVLAIYGVSIVGLDADIRRIVEDHTK